MSILSADLCPESQSGEAHDGMRMKFNEQSMPGRFPSLGGCRVVCRGNARDPINTVKVVML